MATPSAASGRNLRRDRHDRILTAALSAFVEVGFERASVDDIAARAGVSKATLYNHFEDKKGLFVECALRQAEDLQAVADDLARHPSTGVDDDLQAFGERVLRFLLSPTNLAMRRVITAEVARFPELGQAVFERCLRPVQVSMELFFRERQAALAIPDPRLAAVHFLALCESDLFWRVALGILRAVPEEAIRDAVSQAVALFTQAYRR